MNLTQMPHKPKRVDDSRLLSLCSEIMSKALAANLAGMGVGTSTTLSQKEKGYKIVKSLPIYDDSMNLTSYFSMFEREMTSEGIPKAVWPSVINKCFTGKVWQYWADCNEDGTVPYDECKECVLNLKGESIVSCIENLFFMKCSSVEFGERLTFAKACLKRVLKGCNTEDEVIQRILMCLVLSSYSKDCMVECVDHFPKRARELAGRIGRFVETHPEAIRRYPPRNNQYSKKLTQVILGQVISLTSRVVVAKDIVAMLVIIIMALLVILIVPILSPSLILTQVEVQIVVF